MKLHLGCGTKRMSGWINVDSVKGVNPDLVHDLRLPFPYKDLSIEEILAEDLLEHFDKYMRVQVFSEWARVLSIGGKITIQVPNVHKVLFYRYFKFKFDDLMDTLFGENLWNGKVYIGDFGNHKWGYSPQSLAAFVNQFGIKAMEVKTVGLNIRFIGIKERHVSQDDVDNFVILSHNNQMKISFGDVKKKIHDFNRDLNAP
jgi:hypothetical protein